MKEQEKYEALWAREDYRKYSPGEEAVPMFLEMAKPRLGDSVLDIGCGTGRASVKMRDAGLVPTGIDFVNALEISMPFVKVDVRNLDPYVVNADHVFCADFMEHIPTEWVGHVFKTLKRAARNCWFLIPFAEDHYGEAIGEKLHLTVQSFEWWRDVLRDVGNLVDARHLVSITYIKERNILAIKNRGVFLCT